MLGFGRLLKYELKAVGRIMLPIYGVVMAASILMGIASAIDQGSIISEICYILGGSVYAIAMTAVGVFTFVILIQRFYKNLLGNEGYLHLTLPVTTNAQIGAKVVSAGLWMTFGIIVALISVLIMASLTTSPADLLEAICQVFAFIEKVSALNMLKIILLILEGIVLTFLALAEGALKVYAAISLGQLWTEHRIIGAILAYIGFVICETTIANILEKLNVFGFTENIVGSDFAITQIFLVIIIVAVAALMSIYWTVNHRVLSKHLNLQ